MKSQGFSFKKFLDFNFICTFRSIFLRQSFFLSAAIFLFFSFVSAVNSFSLKYRIYPEVFSQDLIHIVIFLPVVDSAVFFIFGNSVVHNRVLYVLPFHISVALGIVVFDCWIRQRYKNVCGRIFAALLVLLFFMVNVDYALRSMNIISLFDFQ